MLYLRLIILSVKDDVSIDSDALLLTDFMNFKIKLTQSFRCAHRSKVCMCVFIGVSTHICINICVYTVFLEKTCAGRLEKWCLCVNLIPGRRITFAVFCKKKKPDHVAGFER
jgi:hypothetical protein